jgi:hypothetical protein
MNVSRGAHSNITCVAPFRRIFADF